MKKIFLIIYLISFSAPIISQGLVAYYPFNGNANDESGNGNNGIVYGATLATDRFGQTASAYYFNGFTDSIVVLNSSSLNPSYITIAVWVNYEGASNNGHIVSKGLNQYDLFVRTSIDDAIGGHISNTNITSTVPLPDSVWTFLCLVKAENMIHLYKDSVLIKTEPLTGQISASLNHLTIGRHPHGDDSKFKGKIDDIRIYNRALNNSEIQNLFNETIPVELVSFIANYSNNSVELSWTTITEKNNLGFEIERNSDAGFGTIGFLSGCGTSTEIHKYEFVDKNISRGNYEYRLKQVDFDGSYCYSDIVKVNVANLEAFELYQNYPNPFNPSTTIRYELQKSSKVILKVFNLIGVEIISLVNEEKTPGTYEVKFDASLLSSGIYFYQVNLGNYLQTKKMILLK